MIGSKCFQGGDFAPKIVRAQGYEGFDRRKSISSSDITFCGLINHKDRSEAIFEGFNPNNSFIV